MTKKKIEESSEEKPKKTTKRKPNGQFEKGCPKLGGRKAGTKNKYGNIRDRLKEIILPYLEPDPETIKKGAKSLATDLMKIDDPKDRAEVVSKFMPYLLPRYTSTTITADSERPINEEEQLMELDKHYTKKEVTLTVKQVTIVNNDNMAAPSAIPITDFDPDEEDDFDLDSIQ